MPAPPPPSPNTTPTTPKPSQPPPPPPTTTPSIPKTPVPAPPPNTTPSTPKTPPPPPNTTPAIPRTPVPAPPPNTTPSTPKAVPPAPPPNTTPATPKTPPPPPPNTAQPTPQSAPNQGTATAKVVQNATASSNPVGKPNPVVAADGHNAPSNQGGGLIKRAKSAAPATDVHGVHGVAAKAGMSSPVVVKGSVRPGALHNFRGHKGNEASVQSEMASHFDSEEIKRLGKRFRKLDLDNSGALSMDEFMTLPELQQNPLVQRVIDIFDADGNGEVDFKEFIQGVSQFSVKGDRDAKLRFAFRIYDMDNDGYISNGELFQVLKMMVGNNLKDTQLQQIVDKTILFSDKDRDGKISYQEFCGVVASTDFHKKMIIDV